MLQLLVFAAIVACGFAGVDWPEGPARPLAITGIIVAACGSVLLILGVRALGDSFTPLPRPRALAELRRDGIYGRVRHPIYGGVLLLALGWSVAWAPLGLAPTALLAVVFELKARREEAWLAELHPEYAGYRARTPRRFVPWLL